MLTEKENFLRQLDGQPPERLTNQYGPLVCVMSDPVSAYLMGEMGKQESVDPWGVTFVAPPGVPGRMPVTDEAHKVIKDITHWRDYVTVPDLKAHCSNEAAWAAARKTADEVRAQGYIPTALMGTGIFERLHYLMGFEDALMGLLEEPDDMQDLIEAITQHRLEYLQLIIDNLHPDAILSHDDWGSKQNLFMSPGTWREFFKEPYRRFYQLARDNGIITVHHADSHCTVIARDMAEVGIQVWQGVLPQNDIAGLQKTLGGKPLLMGGIDAAIVDREDATEEDIRAEARRAFMEYGPGGGFIPSITQGVPTGTIRRETYDIISDELCRCNREVYGVGTLPGPGIAF